MISVKKDTNMTGKKILAMMISLSVLAAVLFLTSCKHSQTDSLQFVGSDRSKPRQSAASPRPCGMGGASGIVVVTHGWIKKGRGGWPEDMAVAISKSVGQDNWLCGYFDWSEGAKTFNATSAARYARDIAGPKLAKEIIELGDNFEHIHLIGHSSGCWAISEAAKILAQKTSADIHLTFFDAYVPAFWQESSLGDVQSAADANYWADHYYTRDYTLGWTQHNLSCAHNVDVTEIDQGIKDHNFPWKWYHATIIGKYPKGYLLDDRKLVRSAGGTEYGFARSREAAGPDSWRKTIKLPVGNSAIKLKKKEM